MLPLRSRGQNWGLIENEPFPERQVSFATTVAEEVGTFLAQLERAQ